LLLYLLYCFASIPGILLCFAPFLKLDLSISKTDLTSNVSNCAWGSTFFGVNHPLWTVQPRCTYKRSWLLHHKTYYWQCTTKCKLTCFQLSTPHPFRVHGGKIRSLRSTAESFFWIYSRMPSFKVRPTCFVRRGWLCTSETEWIVHKTWASGTHFQGPVLAKGHAIKDPPIFSIAANQWEPLYNAKAVRTRRKNNHQQLNNAEEKQPSANQQLEQVARKYLMLEIDSRVPKSGPSTVVRFWKRTTFFQTFWRLFMISQLILASWQPRNSISQRNEGRTHNIHFFEKFRCTQKSTNMYILVHLLHRTPRHCSLRWVSSR